MDGGIVPAKRQRVLVVDDDEGVRDTLIITLKREGYSMAGASTAEQAWDQINATHYDLIMLDVNLAGTTSGIDLLKTLRKRYSLLALPVVMISGTDDTEHVLSALRHGANDYLVKPLNIHTVRARIKNQLSLKQLNDINSHLLRTTSHDLKKPIMLMLDVVRQHMENCPPGKVMTEDEFSALSLLIDSAEYMQQIINTLLHPDTLQSGQVPVTKMPTDLGAIVRQAVAHNIDYARSKGIELELKFSSEIPRIMADEVRILQVLDNLIGNSIKFSPPGSLTRVSTQVENGSLLCEVSDTGPGIPEGDIGRLFTEFSSLSNLPTGKEKSTGLGLAICKEFIQLHNGEIGVRNNEEKGATFWFRLPLNAGTSSSYAVDH